MHVSPPLAAWVAELHAKGWGRYGGEPPCTHLIMLVKRMRELGVAIWSEHGVQPDGWVNVSCEQCCRTYEVTLREPWETE